MQFKYASNCLKYVLKNLCFYLLNFMVLLCYGQKTSKSLRHFLGSIIKLIMKQHLEKTIKKIADSYTALVPINKLIIIIQKLNLDIIYLF